MTQAALQGVGTLILSRSKALRLLTLLLFYFTQGFPVGLFFYAIPAWMAASGASTADVASVVATSALPWSLKLVNGFIIDRYTFLPMGRRRIWIIGAQFLIVIALLAGAALSPDGRDVLLISALGFCANAAVTFQDVGIDSLAVDIMEEEERARAASVMFGAQMLGISAATALGGQLIQNFGISAGLTGLAMVPLAVMVYGIAIRERGGERRLPWSAGESHAANRAIQVEAWWPLLCKAFAAIVVPISLLLLPILVARSVPWGAFESFHPALFQDYAGWSMSDYTDLVSAASLASGIIGLLLFGIMVDRIGSRLSSLIASVLMAALLIGMGFSRSMWSEGWFLASFLVCMEIAGILFMIAVIPICMRMCSPWVAATQFTIYMACGNFGRPIGARLAAVTAGEGNPQLMYWIMGAIFVGVAVLFAVVRFPDKSATQDEVADDLPQGEGIAPALD